MRRTALLLLLPLLSTACRTEPEPTDAMTETQAFIPATPAPQELLVDAGEFARARNLRMELTFSGAGATFRDRDPGKSGRDLICRAGMRTALVNGTPVRLARTVEERDGRLLLPGLLVEAADRAWGSRPPSSPAMTARTAPGPVEPRADRPRPTGSLVVLDPGHGGCLTGARGVSSGTWEKEITLDIAKELRGILESRGIQVVLLREDDRVFFPPSMAGAGNLKQVQADLAERVRMTNSARPDLFVSIHANWAASGADPEGFEVYYPRNPAAPVPPQPRRGKARKAPFDWSAYGAETSRVLDRMAKGNREEVRWKDSRDLAEAVRSSLHGALSTPDRGIRMADFKVIRESEVPAILVETGFLSNPQEDRRLNSPIYQRRVAEAMAGGIERFLSTRR